MSFLLAKSNLQDLTTIRALLEEGKIKPVIEKTFTLDQLPEAFTHFSQGRAAGKIVINVK